MGTKSAKKASTTRGKIGNRKLRPAVAYFVTVLLLAGLSLWIRTGFPIYAIANAAFDDVLFVRLADYFHSGKWLGPYDQLTLVKGMVYSIFIAITHFFTVPLKLAEQAVYLTASGLVAELLRRKTVKNSPAVALFALLAFNPVLWNYQLARVIREGLYISECLVVVLLAVMVFFPPFFSDPKRRDGAFWKCSFLGGILGLVAVAYWLTREEGIWLVPSLGVVALIRVLKIFRSPRFLVDQEEPSARSQRLKAVTLGVVVAFSTFAAGDYLVAGLNYRYYGVLETNELRGRSFLRAYGAVTRISHDHWQQNILFPKDARERAYAVSSAARELRPLLEGPFATGWLNISCSESKLSPCPSEVLSGWFMWEFRGAVQNSGHYQSATEAARFYDALADQIDAACASGAIPCRAEKDSLSPPFRWEYLRQSVRFVPGLTKLLLTLRDGPVGTKASTGSPDEVSFFRTVVGEISSTEATLEGKRSIEGWAASRSGTPSVRLMSRSGDEYPSSISYLPVERTAIQDPTVSAVRFKLQTDCSPQVCALFVVAPGSEPAGIPLSALSSGATYPVQNTRLGIDEITLTDAKLEEDQLPQVRIASALSWLYAIGLPILTLLGFLGIGVAAVWRERAHIPTEIWALAAASAAAVGTRVALLSYISASSFTAFNLLYCSPASTFVIIFAVVGTYCGYSVLSGGESSASRPRNLTGQNSTHVS